MNNTEKYTIIKLITTTLIAILLVSCGSGSSTTTAAATSESSVVTTSQTLTSNTTAIESVPTGFGEVCSKLARTTTSCQAAREALGLSGDWLAFSCNITLGLATSSYAPTTIYSNATYVSMTLYSLPDYKGNYFPTTGSYSFTANGNLVAGTFLSMYEAYTTTYENPNSIAQKTLVVYIPINPTHSALNPQMPGGVVGVGVSGGAIFSSVAGNTDNIFTEVGTFDKCQGHPDVTSQYHYHTEPFAISYQDSNLIGVMRDGYFVYGRYDYGSTTDIDVSNTSSDAYKYGGHVGSNPVTGLGSIFHYHATKQTGCIHRLNNIPYSDDGNTTCSTGLATAGILQTGYFLTGHGNGGVFMNVPTTTVDGASIIKNTAAVRYYYGTAANCTGC